MTRIILPLFCILIFFASILLAVPPDTLTIFHVTDTHSHLLPYCSMDESGRPTKGGIARMATALKQQSAVAKNSLFLHAGDFMVGDVMYNKFMDLPELKILQSLGCDALTIGNHEFDIGPDTLQSVLQRANLSVDGFDLLSANLDLSQKPVLANLIKPYTIKTVGDLQVGLFGLTPLMANEFSSPGPVVITSPAKAARAMVDTLKDKCDFIVLLSHVGAYDEPALIDSLTETGHFVDLVVSGHDHNPRFVPLVVQAGDKETPIVSAGSYYDYLGKVVLAYSQESGLELLSSELIELDPTIEEDPEVAHTVANLAHEIELDDRYGPIYSKVIAEALEPVTLAHQGDWKDTGLGNLVTDALRDTTKTDIALDVWGFLRQDICAGPLTGADIFQAVSMGYNPVSGLGYELVTFELSGISLQLGIGFAMSNALVNKDFGLQVSGAELVFSATNGEFNLSSIRIGGQPLGIFSTYSITTTDGLAQFLSLAGLVPNNLQKTGISQYAAVRDYAVKKSPLLYKAEGRIVDATETGVNTPDAPEIPQQFILHPNYPNPFSSSTTVHYEIHLLPQLKSGPVKIAVYDVLGRQVKVLENQRLNSGAYSVSWDGNCELGTNAPNGIYFIKIQVGSQVGVQKILLTR